MSSRLGILGGGQLAKMLALAAANLGVETRALERRADCPAAACTHVEVGDWNDAATLLRFAETVDVVTLESEFIDPAGLEALESAGVVVQPPARTLRRIQDKLEQTRRLASAGLPVARFRAVETPADVHEAAEALGWPLVLKARFDAYDGKGNETVESPDEVAGAWERLGGPARKLYVEEFCAFERELAVIVARGRDGRTACYPVVETVQRDHICHEVTAPADISPAVAADAVRIARAAAEMVDHVGSLGVELFLLPGEDPPENQVLQEEYRLPVNPRLLVNELAPRVHNSGHYSIEACVSSQFENHVRAVLGWPLGSTELVAPAAMVNLLGDGEGPGEPAGLTDALAVPGAHFHIYGKAVSRPGRKMGHVTALGESASAALETARRAAAALHFGDPS